MTNPISPSIYQVGSQINFNTKVRGEQVDQLCETILSYPPFKNLFRSFPHEIVSIVAEVDRRGQLLLQVHADNGTFQQAILDDKSDKEILKAARFLVGESDRIPHFPKKTTRSPLSPKIPAKTVQTPTSPKFVKQRPLPLSPAFYSDRYSSASDSKASSPKSGASDRYSSASDASSSAYTEPRSPSLNGRLLEALIQEQARSHEITQLALEALQKNNTESQERMAQIVRDTQDLSREHLDLANQNEQRLTRLIDKLDRRNRDAARDSNELIDRLDQRHQRAVQFLHNSYQELFSSLMEDKARTEEAFFNLLERQQRPTRKKPQEDSLPNYAPNPEQPAPSPASRPFNPMPFAKPAQYHPPSSNDPMIIEEVLSDTDKSSTASPRQASFMGALPLLNPTRLGPKIICRPPIIPRPLSPPFNLTAYVSSLRQNFPNLQFPLTPQPATPNLFDPMRLLVPPQPLDLRSGIEQKLQKYRSTPIQWRNITRIIFSKLFGKK